MKGIPKHDRSENWGLTSKAGVLVGQPHLFSEVGEVGWRVSAGNIQESQRSKECKSMRGFSVKLCDGHCMQVLS